MIHSSAKKIVDYAFEDFSEEFGFEAVDQSRSQTVSRQEEVVFSVRRKEPDSGESEIPETVYSEDIPEADLEEAVLRAEEKADELTEAIRAAELRRAESERILQDAKEQADRIIQEAMAAAETIRNNAVAEASAALGQAEQTGYNEGFEKGQNEGFQNAYEETRRELDEQNRSLLEEISRAIAELERQKTDYIRQYSEEMKDLVIAIAEKVIKISLKSSSDVIRRMILAAVESRTQKEWVKIYISEYDANLIVREDNDILEALRKVSDHVKIVTMENGQSGDLIVEYPDQAIDAGVNTQLENIRQLMAES